MYKAYVRPGAMLLWSVTQHRTTKGLQSCPAVFMAGAAMLAHPPHINYLACPMPRYCSMTKYCPTQASPFWPCSKLIRDITATTNLSLTFYHVWLGVYMSF